MNLLKFGSSGSSRSNRSNRSLAPASFLPARRGGGRRRGIERLERFERYFRFLWPPTLQFFVDSLRKFKIENLFRFHIAFDAAHVARIGNYSFHSGAVQQPIRR